jgi:hypothetical protein
MTTASLQAYTYQQVAQNNKDMYNMKNSNSSDWSELCFHWVQQNCII